MVWARLLLLGGLVVVFAAFAYGTEKQSYASVTNQTYDCGAAISASWLVPGTPGQSQSVGSKSSDEERRATSACESVVHESRLLVLTTMALGGLLAVAGWTVLREPPDPQTVSGAPAHR